MEEVTYYLGGSSEDILLMKQVRDPQKDNILGFIWNINKKEWVRAWMLDDEYFFGYESAKVIDVEEAKKYMIKEGATDEEAAELIKKDIDEG